MNILVAIIVVASLEFTLSFSQSQRIYTSTRPLKSTCNPLTEFTCDDGTCVDISGRCDRTRYDCADGTDEYICDEPTQPTSPTECNPRTEFTCGDGTCVDISGRCDRTKYDCYDGTDEFYCEGYTQAPRRCNARREFTCTDRSCVRIDKKCNGRFDCPDRSDEQNCAKPTFPAVNDAPYNVSVTEGESFTFNCSPVAKPEAKIVWLLDGKELDPNNLPKRFVLRNDSRSLTIRNVCRDCVDRESKTDLTVIQCNASNVHGYAFAKGYLNVQIAPQQVTIAANTVTTVTASQRETVFLPWWVVLVSALSFGALLLLVGLGIGLRCRRLSKTSVVTSGNQNEHRTKNSSDNLYDVRYKAIDMPKVA